MIQRILGYLIGRNEHRLGASLDYVRKIAATDFSLLMRYNRLFGFLDPRRKTPADAYHAARLCGALAADCGTCVGIEINLAKQAGLDPRQIEAIITNDIGSLAPGIVPVVQLANAVVRDRMDDPEAREKLVSMHGEAGLIELAYAMNGAALLPGIKRAMGYATACDIETMRRLSAKAAS